MKRTLMNISIDKASKVLAIVTGIFSALICIPMFFYSYFTTRDPGAFFFLIVPLIYLVLGYIFALIYVWTCNMALRWVGGIDYTTIDSDNKDKLAVESVPKEP